MIYLLFEHTLQQSASARSPGHNNSPSPPSSLFVKPCPFPRLRPLLALAFGLGCRPGCFWDTWSRPPPSGDCDRQHVDPTLVHLTEHLRWSRINHNNPSPVDTPLDRGCLRLSCFSLPSPLRVRLRLRSFDKWGKAQRESQHAQDNTRNQPGDPRA